MGYDARFVVECKGSHGHAWVSLRQDSRYYVVEPQYWIVGDTFPRLSTIQFHPEFSPGYAKALIEKRYDRVNDPDAALASLDAPNDNERVGEWIRRFLTETEQ